MMKHDLSGRFWTETLKKEKQGKGKRQREREKKGQWGLAYVCESVCMKSQRDPEANKGTDKRAVLQVV